MNEITRDLHAILQDHRSKKKELVKDSVSEAPQDIGATLSEIPDVFFDQILVDFKLSRIEIMVIMYLYRQVWCRPNLYRTYGISPLLSHTEMAKTLHLTLEDIYHALVKLETFQFISTIRSGQYFVRKFFLKDNDAKYGITYDNFDE